MMTAEDAPNEPITNMMAVEMQRTNPIARMTADENAPNEPTGEAGIYAKSVLSAASE
jgi:hypothetical protein